MERKKNLDFSKIFGEFQVKYEYIGQYLRQHNRIHKLQHAKVSTKHMIIIRIELSNIINIIELLNG